MFVAEGETIHRAAAALRTALVGRPIVRFDAPRLVGPPPALGRIVERVESHGKHLEIVWDDGLVLHTNLRLTGSWHLYRDDERWRRPATQMRVELVTKEWVAVCFNAPVVETYREFDRSRHPGFGSHGPDLSQPGADIDESINRLYHYPDQQAPISEALLDQHVADSIGNAYRCEVLWACEVHPFALIAALDADDCAFIVTTAAQLLRSKLQHSPRVTASITAGSLLRGELAVYGRNGQPCARCGDTVEVCRSGDHDRLLYWCPGCQVERSPLVLPDLDDSREIDPHPAAAKFLSGLPWRRNDPLAG
jgi:endonuclease VIII